MSLHHQTVERTAEREKKICLSDEDHACAYLVVLPETLSVRYSEQSNTFLQCTNITSHILLCV